MGWRVVVIWMREKRCMMVEFVGAERFGISAIGYGASYNHKVEIEGLK